MRYQVIGKNHRVFGKSHGEYFERNLPEAQERHLIGGGFIVRAPLPKKKSAGQLPKPSAALFVPPEPSEAKESPSEAPEEVPTETPRRDEF
jgi:hypothetical protein